MSHTLTASLALLVAGLALGACDQSETMKAEIGRCETVARLALHEPAGFKVTGSEVEETSEGEAVILDVDYTDAAGTAVHVREKCWFAGYGEKKVLKQLLIEKDNRFIAIPSPELEQYKKQLAG